MTAGTVAAYLRWVHQGAVTADLDARVVVSRTTVDAEIGRYRSRSFPLAELDAAAEYVTAASRAGLNVFARCSLVDAPLDGERTGAESLKRGGADRTRWVTHLAADLDIAGPGHAASNLPPTVAAAVDLADRVRRPSAVVSSGGGVYPVWRLSQPVDVADDTVRERVRAIGRRLDAALASHGHHVDRVAGDLSRHLRPPGVLNLKPGRDPKPVVVLRGYLDPAAGGDVTLDELDELLPPLAAAAVTEAGNTPARFRADDTATPWAILAERYSIDDILAADPVHRWERVADQYLDGVTRAAWRRAGSSADYSLKLGDHGLVVWSASFAAELGIEPGRAVTGYRLLRHFAGVTR